MSKRRQSVRSNRVCFTLNNPSDSEIECLTTHVRTAFSNGWLEFCVIGKEVGEKGTPHLQGFIHLKTSYLKAVNGNVSYWKKLPGLQRSHLESARGTDLESQVYCRKDGNVLVELGEPALPLSRWQKIVQSTTMEQILEDDPEAVVKHYFAIEKILARQRQATISAPEKLLPWQKECLNRVVTQNSRQILFVVDLEGGCGKSILARWMMHHWGAFSCRGGKMADLAHARSKMPTAVVNVFDFARVKKVEQWPMDFLEQVKDSWMLTTKYDSGRLVLPDRQRVVVFSNVAPDPGVLSADRYDIWHLDSTQIVLSELSEENIPALIALRPK